MKKLYAYSLLFFATACNEIPGEAYFNRGSPESLLDVSSEVVNMSVPSGPSVHDLATMLSQDPPSQAEINCDMSQKACQDALAMLERHNVPTQQTNGPLGITLIYERVVARDCENRYIDNSINPYNLHPPTMGCSVAANIVQMVSNKQQIVNPSLMDLPDAEKAVQTYRVYLTAPDPAQDTEQQGGLLQTISTN